MAEPGGTAWLSVPEAARHLGISERAVRKRITTGHLNAERDGTGPWRVRVSTAPEAVPRGTEDGTTVDSIEAAYRVTPAEIEQAVSRTSAQYMGDLRTMLAEVGKVYDGQLAAKDETIAAKNAALAAKDETIAELRRRAEEAEEEVVRRREAEAARLARVSALVRARAAASGVRRSGSLLLKQLNQVSDEQEAQAAWGAGPPAPRAPTFWERVRTRLRGE